MKNIIAILVLAVTFGACKETPKDVVKETAEKEEVSMKKTDSEWMTLFDGTNFDNWRGYGEEGMHPEWVVEDGAMAFTPGETGGKNIISKQKFTNFVLSIEWKISEGGNSGIFWSVYEDDKFNEAYQTGPEIQVLDNERHPDSKVAEGTHKAGALYDMIACPNEFINPAGEWNL